MHRNANDWERLDFFFSCSKWNGNLMINEKDKCDDFKCFNLNSLPDNMVPYVKYAAKSFLENIRFSEFGWK